MLVDIFTSHVCANIGEGLRARAGNMDLFIFKSTLMDRLQHSESFKLIFSFIGETEELQ